MEASTQKRNQSKKCRTKRSDTFSAHFDVGGKCRVLVRALVLLTHDTIISRSVSVEASTQRLDHQKGKPNLLRKEETYSRTVMVLVWTVGAA